MPRPNALDPPEALSDNAWTSGSQTEIPTDLTAVPLSAKALIIKGFISPLSYFSLSPSFVSIHFYTAFSLHFLTLAFAFAVISFSPQHMS
jgi:hypothetical protein